MPEGQNIEWKSSWRDEYLKWICGFANAQGGILFIGKDDKGHIVDLSNYQSLMDDLPNKIKDQLGILCDINLYEDNSLNYIEIITKPYDVPISFRGKYYYRSGSTNQLLAGAELTDFLLRKSGKTWDDVIEPQTKIEEINSDAIADFKKGAIKSKRLSDIEDESVEYLFENLRLIENNQLKRAAILAFYNDPKIFFTNAYVKIGKFGKTDDDLKYQEIIEGNAFQLADQVIDILNKKFLTSPISYEGLHRIEDSEYPYDAVQEAILNAIVHRNYSGAPIQISVYNNKLVVWNEGSLPNGLTEDDLKVKHPSRPKNPVLADIFFKGGLIEAWGRGTIKIIEDCKKHGLPEPEIKVAGGGISVTMYNGMYYTSDLKNLGLNQRQLEVIEYLALNKTITNKEYSEKFKVSRNTASRDLNNLTSKKILKSSGLKGAGASYKLVIKIV